jgi:hypothetical protein
MVIIRIIYIYSFLLICMLTSACDFNINDSPGPQMSFSIKQAKEHGTFICQYLVKDNIINGVKINTIFAEKKFWREEGFFERKTINCCESQLVIISDGCFSCDGIGPYDTTWNISGFDLKSSYAILANFKGTIFSDIIPIRVITKSKNGDIITTTNLTKIKNDDK